MKPSRVFWGVLFVVLGTLLLGAKIFALDFDVSVFWKLWPLVLVLLGISIMFKNQKLKWVLAGAAAIVAALFLYGILSFSWFPWHGTIEIGDNDASVRVQEFTEPMNPEVTEASFVLDAAAGTYTLEADTGALCAVRIQSTLGPYTLSRTGTGTETVLRLGLEHNDEHRSINFKRVKNDVDISLHRAPLWDLDIDVGAAKGEFDLRELNVVRLNLDAGAATVRLQLGMPKTETRVTIDAGAASVRVSVPYDAACEVEFDGGLSSKRLHDFNEVETGLYRTPDFSDTAKKIYIKANAGVSSFRVEREGK